MGGTAGVVEEPLFRGVVLRSMGAIRGRRWAIVVSAAAFSLIHMDLIGAPTRFVVGLLLAMLTWRAGGILPSVFAHAAYNGAALFTGFLGNRYFPDFSSFSFLRDLPAGGAEVLTWVLLSLPFAAAVWGCWRLYCRVSPGQGWRDRPHLPNPGGTAVLPWGILALVTASYTAVNTILLWYLPRLGQLLPSGFGG